MKENNVTPAIIGGMIGLPAALAVVAVLCVWQGFALQIMWGWFVAPTFGLPLLTLPVSIGLALVSSLLTKQHIPKDQGKPWGVLVHNVLSPACILLAGWIVTKAA